MRAASDSQLSLDSTIAFLPRCSGVDVDSPNDGSPVPTRCGSPLVVRNRDGEISHVQISSWRRVAAGPGRRIAKVSMLNEGVAILIETGDREQGAVKRCWQAYDSDGRLTAVVQLTSYQQQAMRYNYQSRRACRVARNERGQRRSRGDWTI